MVAAEVRILAQRSADAAKEIKTLISSSASQVKQGVELVSRTGEALTRIVGQVVDINRAVAEISIAAQDQSRALGEINHAVLDMDKITQGNASMVEETTAAARGLAEQTEDLAQLTARYQYRTGARAPAARPPSGRRRAVVNGPLLAAEADWAG